MKKEKLFKGILVSAGCLGLTMALSFMPAQAKKGSDTKGEINSKISWEYDKTKKSLTIKGKGGLYASDLRYSSSSHWPASGKGIVPKFKKIIFKDGITKVGWGFFMIEGVKTISLPKTVKAIDYSASDDWINGYSLDPFSTTLTKIEVNKKNKNLRSVGGVLFSKNMKKLYFYPGGKSKSGYTVPGKVTTIGKNAFSGSSIKKIRFGNKLKKISDESFYMSAVKDVVFPGSLTGIGKKAFYECALTAVKFPSQLDYIKARAFYKNKIEKVTFGKNLTEIGIEAFDWNPIKAIDLPESLTSLGNYAFAHNAFLETISINSTLDLSEPEPFYKTSYRPENLETDDSWTSAEYKDYPLVLNIGAKMGSSLETLLSKMGKKLTISVDNQNKKYHTEGKNLIETRTGKVIYTME